MVTDRVCTAAILLVLSHLYPEYRFFFTLCMMLDIFSHWVQMYSSLATHRGSHKAMNENDPKILQLYYTNRIVLFLVCFFNEAFFVLAYIYKQLYL